MRPLFLTTLLALFWIACKGPGQQQPFESLLRQPPYLEWTLQIDQHPETDSLYYRRAQLLYENEYTEPALIDLKKAWSIRPTSPYALGIATLLEADSVAQFQFLKEALHQFPHDYPLELELATLLDKQGSTDSAQAITTYWIQQGKRETDLYLLHASLLDQKGKRSEALQILEALYLRTPQDRQIAEMLALRFAESGNDKLLILCRNFQEQDSLNQDAAPFYYLGIFYAVKKQYPEALRQFDRAIQTDHNFIDAYIEKSSLLLDRKDPADALKILDKALQIAPDHAPVYYWTAKCQQALGDRESARLNYLKAYGLDNRFTEAKQAADKLK